MSNLHSIHFFNQYYCVPILREFFARKPSEIKKDYRREISFDVLHPMATAYDPLTTDLETAAAIAKATLSAKLDYLNTEKIKDDKSKKFIRTGNWVEVSRNHFPQGSDSFRWLIITERGYYSNIRNKSPLQHLGWDKQLISFKEELQNQTALYQFFSEWDGQSPFLVIELVSGAIDVDKLRLSYDARNVVINSDTQTVLNLEQLSQSKNTLKGIEEKTDE